MTAWLRQQGAAWLRANRARLTALNHWFALHVCGAPAGLSCSAYSWRLETQGKPWGRFWRCRIDGFFLLVFSQDNHCQKAFDHDSAAIAQEVPHA